MTPAEILAQLKTLGSESIKKVLVNMAGANFSMA
jgi:hypothetical protein